MSRKVFVLQIRPRLYESLLQVVLEQKADVEAVTARTSAALHRAVNRLKPDGIIISRPAANHTLETMDQFFSIGGTYFAVLDNDCAEIEAYRMDKGNVSSSNGMLSIDRLIDDIKLIGA